MHFLQRTAEVMLTLVIYKIKNKIIWLIGRLF